LRVSTCIILRRSLRPGYPNGGPWSSEFQTEGSARAGACSSPECLIPLPSNLCMPSQFTWLELPLWNFAMETARMGGLPGAQRGGGGPDCSGLRTPRAATPGGENGELATAAESQKAARKERLLDLTRWLNAGGSELVSQHRLADFGLGVIAISVAAAIG
jgi:hypothetical protein